MAKRGENIYFRKDERYEGRCIKGRKDDGTIIYHYVYAKSFKECKQKLTQAKFLYFHHDVDCKIYGTGTVAEFMNYWINNIIESSVKMSTLSNYVNYNKKWITPNIGKEKLYNLKEEQIQQFINHLSKQGLSAGSVHNIYRTLNAALKKAKSYGYTKTNPCDGVILPENKQKKTEILSLAKQKKLETVCMQSLVGLIVFLSLYTGLRVGEICALKWSDIDFKNKTLSVTKTRQRIQYCGARKGKSKTYVETGSAKSESSERIIPLPSFLLKRLQKHKKTTTNKKYVFTYREKPLEPRVIQYRFKKLLEKSKLEKINFHALRHTFATRCMERNIDIKTISELLGHSSAKITIGLYAHSRFEQKQATMKNLQKLHLAS